MVTPTPTSELDASTRKLERWLAIIVVVLAGVLVWGLVTGLNKKSSHASATPPSQAGVLGATSPPTNPALVPLGRYASIGPDWHLKVVAVLRNVSQNALGLLAPLQPGTQNIVVEFTVRYAGSGRRDSGSVVDRMNATLGGSNAVYAAKRGCLGGGKLTVSAGHPATTNACFTVSSNRVRRLKLFVFHSGGASGPRTWFALR